MDFIAAVQNLKDQVVALIPQLENAQNLASQIDQAGFERGFQKAASQYENQAGAVPTEGASASVSADVEQLKAEIESQKVLLSQLQEQVAQADKNTEAAVAAKQAEMIEDFKSAKMDDEALIAKYSPKAEPTPADPVQEPVSEQAPEASV